MRLTRIECLVLNHGTPGFPQCFFFSFARLISVAGIYQVLFVSTSEFDTKLIWLAGTSIISTTGFLVASIKGAFEIRKLKMELASLTRNAKSAESRIYIPTSTEERVRYGGTKMFRAAVIAIGCAVISVSSASIAIPTIRLQLRDAAEVNRRLELKIAEQEKDSKALKERLKLAEDAFLRAVNTAHASPVPQFLRPQLAKPSPTPISIPGPYSLPTRTGVLDEISSRIDSLNWLMLRTIRNGDYEYFLRYVHPSALEKFPPAEFESLRAKRRQVDPYADPEEFLGRVPTDNLSLYIWRLRPLKRGATVIETLGVADNLVTFLTLEVYEFPADTKRPMK